jgi:hypothetical protein
MERSGGRPGRIIHSTRAEAFATQNWAPIALAEGKLLIRDQHRMIYVRVAEQYQRFGCDHHAPGRDAHFYPQTLSNLYNYFPSRLTPLGLIECFR